MSAAATPRPVPRHIAIIMDGNGRWAKARGLPRIAGHRRGAEAARRTVIAAAELGVPYLTLFGFSSENWKRPSAEIQDLMGLLRHYLRGEIADRSGGQLYRADTVASLPQAFAAIAAELRTQYLLGYYPTNKAHDGTYRTIKVTVDEASGRDHRIALTRSGRTAAVPGAAVRPAIRTNASPRNNNVRQPATNSTRRPPL